MAVRLVFVLLIRIKPPAFYSYIYCTINISKKGREFIKWSYLPIKWLLLFLCRSVTIRKEKCYGIDSEAKEGKDI